MSMRNILDQPISDSNQQSLPTVGWWFEYAGILFLLAAVAAYFLPNNPTGDNAIYIYSFKGLFLRFSALAIYFHIIGGIYLYVNRTLRWQTSQLLGQLHFVFSILALLAAGVIIWQLSAVEPNQDNLGLFLSISSVASKLFLITQLLFLHIFFGEKAD